MSNVDELESMTREHVLKALTDIDSGQGDKRYGPSREWDLVVGDKRYPPKMVVGTAAAHALGRPLARGEVSGGDGKNGANRILRNLGFSIQPKPGASSAGASDSPKAIDFDELSSRVLDGTAAISHNMAVLRAVVGGTEMALDPMIEFDPRDDFWRRPERRFLVAFLSRRFPRWPQEDEVQEPLAEFAVEMSRRVDALRSAGKITFLSVEYDEGGGLSEVLKPLRELFTTMEPLPQWATIRRRHHESPSAARSLLSFLEGIERDGFRKHERALGRLIRWWPVLGASTVQEFEEKQRFFWAYRHALMSNNAYANAGAQYFGPIIGNTPTSSMLEALRRWRDGESTSSVPMMGIGKDDEDDAASDRSHTNIAREIWGFLNLERAPFYNNQVAAYGAFGTTPEHAVTMIGEQTRKWLGDNQDICKRLADAFSRAFDEAARESGSPFAEARRWKVGGGGSPFDATLNQELVSTARKRLSRLPEIDRAAILLHVALDSQIRPHGATKPDGSSTASEPTETTPPGSGSPRIALKSADRVWIYAPGARASHWGFDLEHGVASIGWSAEGDLSKFGSKQELLDALALNRESDGQPIQAAKSCWDFANHIKVGDPVIARKGRGKIIGIGIVKRPYFWAGAEDFPSRVGVEWIWSGEIDLEDRKTLSVKTLVESSRRKNLMLEIDSKYRALTSGNDVDDDEGDELSETEPYSREDALADLFMPDAQVDRMVQLLRRRKNMIIQGPPGVGKTFVAKRIAYLLMEERAKDRLEMVQFHQAYTYEQFVRGYRPGDGAAFKLEDGPLFRIAEQARGDADNAYVLIIDEINRGNLSKILGEAMMLLEADKRSSEWGLRLAYARHGVAEEVPFHLPENLFVIGTMNTADRSLAMVDYALRRRFVFVDVRPGFRQPRFDEHLEGLPTETLQRLKTTLTELNRRILDDVNLGAGFEIGHSYFCRSLDGVSPWGEDPEGWLDDICRYEVMPLLEEYWHDEPRRLDAARTLLGIG